MKKLYLAIFFSVFISSECVFAKTQGSYLGIDLLDTKLKFYQRNTNDSHLTLTNVKPSYSHNDFGVGMHYNYAVNMGGFFIAPGIFFEMNNSEANGSGTKALERLQIKNRYGAKLDLGVDITNAIAPYLTGGYSGISYDSRDFFNFSGYTETYNKSGMLMDWFYGAGIKFDCDKYTSVSIEYNTQNFAVRNSVNGTTNNLSTRYQTRLDVLKFGVAYRF